MKRLNLPNTGDAGEIQLWKILLSDSTPATIDAAALLSDAELQRVSRLKFAHDRCGYLQSHCALRILLARQLDSDPAALSFNYGPWGKPFLAGKYATRGLHFNLSRTRGMALIGIAWGQELGVDIEAMREIPGLNKILARDFRSSERNLLKSLFARDRTTAFLRLWTAKEAGLKGVGKGLACPPTRAPLILNTRGQVVGIDLEFARPRAGRWSIVSVPTGPNHVAAVATPMQ